MRTLVIVPALLGAAGCNSHGPEEASKCGLTEPQLRQAVQEVSRMKPYTGRRVGRCELIVDDGRDVSVITPEIQQRVEEMIARERAGSKTTFEVVAYERELGPERVAGEIIIPDARTRIPAMLRTCGVEDTKTVGASDGVVLFRFAAPTDSNELRCVRERLPAGTQLQQAMMP